VAAKTLRRNNIRTNRRDAESAEKKRFEYAFGQEESLVRSALPDTH
jgi:hypothetical protein